MALSFVRTVHQGRNNCITSVIYFVLFSSNESTTTPQKWTSFIGAFVSVNETPSLYLKQTLTLPYDLYKELQMCLKLSIDLVIHTYSHVS